VIAGAPAVWRELRAAVARYADEDRLSALTRDAPVGAC
jgi:hypothetical protein